MAATRSLVGGANYSASELRDMVKPGAHSHRFASAVRWLVERAIEQHYAMTSACTLSKSCAREMTAADLGLSLLQSWMLIGINGFRWEVQSDAPYSFWLGADHG